MWIHSSKVLVASGAVVTLLLACQGEQSKKSPAPLPQGAVQSPGLGQANAAGRVITVMTRGSNGQSGPGFTVDQAVGLDFSISLTITGVANPSELQTELLEGGSTLAQITQRETLTPQIMMRGLAAGTSHALRVVVRDRLACQRVQLPDCTINPGLGASFAADSRMDTVVTLAVQVTSPMVTPAPTPFGNGGFPSPLATPNPLNGLLGGQLNGSADWWNIVTQLLGGQFPQVNGALNQIQPIVQGIINNQGSNSQ